MSNQKECSWPSAQLLHSLIHYYFPAKATVSMDGSQVLNEQGKNTNEDHFMEN